MSRSVLDVDAVRAFVTIVDFQSFTKAADALGTTQGAISVKLKRLEARLGHKLIERTPRWVRLSAQGAVFLNAARELLSAHDRAAAALISERRHFRLGIAEHVAGPEIPALLARLNERDPGLTIEVRIDTSRALLSTYDDAKLDAVIVRQEDDPRDGEDLGPEHYGWFASRNFKCRSGDPLPLVALAPCCNLRDLATNSLDEVGLEWVEVFVGGGQTAVVSAVSAGLGIAALARRLAPADTLEISQDYGLPKLPSTRIVLHSKFTDQRSREALRAISAAWRKQ